MAKLYGIDSSVLVIIRTDKACWWWRSSRSAGRAGCIPGAMVIVDDPDIIAALVNPGSVGYPVLDKTWVPQLG